MAEQLILVVEDEEAFIDAVTVCLTREGFRVEVARGASPPYRAAPSGWRP
mgnify:CR=1 FL=1